ncbi:hypothetical protein [Streptomyces antnestii]|uniref:hypothetical protein n=1 Tax=Streptomyces antnestii TaxID=2494256 RepID=UPI00167A167E|nr:hypothetical protein [Streptomyces sp. San01]
MRQNRVGQRELEGFRTPRSHQAATAIGATTRRTLQRPATARQASVGRTHSCAVRSEGA